MTQERERSPSDEPATPACDGYARPTPPREGAPPELPAAEALGVGSKRSSPARWSWLGIKWDDWIAAALLLGGAAAADGLLSFAFDGPFVLLLPLFATGLAVIAGWRWIRGNTRLGAMLNAAERSGDRAAVDVITGTLMILLGLGVWLLSLLLRR